MTTAAGETNTPENIQLGAPVDEFEAIVDTLQQLCQEGKYQIFLAGETTVRLVGEIDEFRLALGKKLGIEVTDRRKVTACLREIQMFLQVSIEIGALSGVVEMFETHIYEDEFAEAPDDSERTQKLRQIIQQKATAVGKLSSDALRERSKRLAGVIGPILQEVDFEIISSRRSPSTDTDIDAPFLRIRLRHVIGGETTLPFIPPFWIDPPKNIRTFDLECDESDIDLLLRRLLQAKALLNKAIEARVEHSKTSKIDEPLR